jgi:hypothetical protein
MKKKARALNLKHLWQELNATDAEQPRLEADLLAGIDLYRHDNEFARHYTDAELLSRPFVMGIGAVEVARDAALSVETRLALVRHTIALTNPTEDHGIPFGLPMLVSFLAGVGLLTEPIFRTLFQLNHMEHYWFDDWQREEIVILLDWLIAKAGVSDDERLWWLFYLLVHCEQPDKGKTMLARVIDHPALPAVLKRRLCDEILSNALPTLVAPPQWRAVQALWQGDRAAYEAARAELPPTEQLPVLPTEDTFEDNPAQPAPDRLSFNFVRSLFYSDFALTPGFLKRQAISCLVTLGEDPLTVCQLYLGQTGYYADAINTGVADVISAQWAVLPEQALRELIDRALSIGAVNTRKVFYRIGIDLFGTEYLRRAQADNANSLRQWANKVARGEVSVPKKRGRKPQAAP